MSNYTIENYFKLAFKAYGINSTDCGILAEIAKLVVENPDQDANHINQLLQEKFSDKFLPSKYEMILNKLSAEFLALRNEFVILKNDNNFNICDNSTATKATVITLCFNLENQYATTENLSKIFDDEGILTGISQGNRSPLRKHIIAKTNNHNSKRNFKNIFITLTALYTLYSYYQAANSPEEKEKIHAQIISTVTNSFNFGSNLIQNYFINTLNMLISKAIIDNISAKSFAQQLARAAGTFYLKTLDIPMPNLQNILDAMLFQECYQIGIDLAQSAYYWATGKKPVDKTQENPTWYQYITNYIISPPGMYLILNTTHRFWLPQFICPSEDISAQAVTQYCDDKKFPQYLGNQIVETIGNELPEDMFTGMQDVYEAAVENIYLTAPAPILGLYSRFSTVQNEVIRNAKMIDNGLNALTSYRWQDTKDFCCNVWQAANEFAAQTLPLDLYDIEEEKAKSPKFG